MSELPTERSYGISIHSRVPTNSARVIARHSEVCRKIHGNFNAFVAAPIANVALDVAENLVWYQSSPASRRVSCGTCGRRVLEEVTPAGRWLFPAGLVDGPVGKRIIRYLWQQSRTDWYRLPVANA